MNKKATLFTLLVVLVLAVTSSSYAAIYEDQYFNSATISLYTYEAASFSADTNFSVGFIRVDSCWLEKWNGSGYSYYCWLPAPSDEETSTISYESYMDFSSYIPNDGGKYRVGAYFNADNHTIRRFSNGRTFN